MVMNFNIMVVSIIIIIIMSADRRPLLDISHRPPPRLATATAPAPLASTEFDDDDDEHLISLPYSVLHYHFI
jgi:hypothetical protein